MNKLLPVVVVILIAAAFFIGRTFPADPDTSLEPGTADAPTDDGDAPILRGDAEVRIRRLEESVQAAQEESERLTASNKELTAQVEAARKAGYLPVASKDGKAEAAAGTRFAPEAHKKVVGEIAWAPAGEAAVKMVPLLEKLSNDFVAGKGVDTQLGIEIFKWNQELQKVAVSAIAAEVPGGGSNGAFTHPVVTINLIQSALANAEVPLSEGQLRSLQEIGDRFMEADTRRMGGYNDETYELQKLIDECALKDRMYDDIHGILTGAQSNVLHPPAIRDRLGIDIYSSGTIWYGVSKAVDFTTREDLATGLLQQYQTLGNLTEEESQVVGAAAKDWADGFSNAYLEASADPLAQTSRAQAASGMLAGWQKVEQARVAADKQLAFNRGLVDLLDRDSKGAAELRKSVTVFIPLKRP